MDDRIRAAFDAIHAEEALKEHTKAALAARQRPAVRRRRLAPLLACLALVVALLGGGGWLWFTPTASVSVDINPSLELRLNRFSRVVAVEGANADGQALAQELRALGGQVGLYPGDVAERAQVDQVMEGFLQDFGHLDVLVCNAGLARQELFTDISLDSWRQMLGVNLDGVFHCCQAALPHMISRKAGKIITLSSMWGQVGASCEVAYSAAKAGVIGLTRALAKEVGPSGITVNCVAPGVIDTAMNGALSPETRAALAEETPLERLGTPEDVAQAIWFLASPAGDFFTGQVLAPNGGFII